MTIRAVAFDLDDTLWDIAPVIARAEARLIEWMREHCPRIPERFTLEDMRAARLRLAEEHPHRTHDYTWLRLEALAHHARECGYGEEIAARGFEVFYAARNELDVFEDVRPALARLGERFLLGTLSNGNADLRRIGLHGFFRVSLSAREVGAAKPDPRGFLRLAEALGVRPSEILYVGDDPVLDVAGARAVGMRTAWINRRGEPWPEGLQAADLCVADCLALADHLLAENRPL
ncbi:MAG: HAD family hydrolase [Pseudomonadota bacterium]|jgi:2-haloalkanoic acid dehalogenase type II